jgi:hypothetical protein
VAERFCCSTAHKSSGAYNQSEVAFSNTGLADGSIGDEREAMRVTEQASGKDVALEARCSGDAEVTTRTKNERQLTARWDGSIRRLWVRSVTSTGHITEVIDSAGSLLTPILRIREVISRSVRNSETGIEAGLRGHEREQQVRLASFDPERIRQIGGLQELAGSDSWLGHHHVW